MPLEAPEFSSSHVELAVAVLSPSPFLIPVVSARTEWRPAGRALQEPSPPDLSVLNSTFLI